MVKMYLFHRRNLSFHDKGLNVLVEGCGASQRSVFFTLNEGQEQAEQLGRQPLPFIYFLPYVEIFVQPLCRTLQQENVSTVFSYNRAACENAPGTCGGGGEKNKKALHDKKGPNWISFLEMRFFLIV